MKNDWQDKLTERDRDLFRMVDTFTGRMSQPRNGGKHCYFLRVDYSRISDPDVVAALMDAIAGRLGDRFISLCDHADKQQFVCYIRYAAPGTEDKFSLTAAIKRGFKKIFQGE